MFTKYKKKILLSVAFGALVFLAFSIYADIDKLIGAFGKFDWLWFPVVLLFSLANYILRFAKWHYYIKLLKIEIRPLKSLLIFLSAFVMSVTPGKMGEVLKSYLLKEENGTSISKSAPIVLAERLTDFISIVLLCILGAFVFGYGQVLIIIAGIVFITSALVLSSRKFSFGLIGMLGKVRFFSKHTDKIHTAYNSIYLMVKFRPLLNGVLISSFAWFMECVGFYIVLNVFSASSNVEVSLLVATFIYGFSTLVGAIAMLPGGLGVTEAFLTGLLIVLKIPKDISVAASLIIRVATLWFAVFIGIVTVFIYQNLTHRKFENITKQDA
ncbi:MAG: lysylphosphatidylglycerol synthase transmembrane domain-containing protein [Ignavibacteriae bacterium]|nr:lysylphosphatidylglycerol synthase transmembrane domain-containing protein [Ignavibacteriota bacterium]